MSGTLLAFGDKVVNEQAVALSPTLGWLFLTAAICVIAMFIANRERWKRWWLTAEDPRAVAVFRIVFAFFVMANINGMWEQFGLLYTDEGIFTADVARQVFAAKQFEGFGDGLSPDDPWGFFDWAAIWAFLKGPKWSLLYFWDSPTFFWAHMVAFWTAGICLMVGFRTRTAGVLTWFLMNSILTRNHLGWEGTELVYRCFLVYLVFARSGHAYSVDNWLRCRKLRKKGLLSERDGPGGGAGAAPTEAHPKGLEPVYRLIPSWPRKLMMLQLATIYITTGTLKTGSVWLAGDSLYYALNLDHFYRLPPQFLSSLAGTTVFRGMTWAVKIGQTSLSLILVGLVARFVIKHRIPGPTGAWRWLARAGFAGLILSSAAIIYVAWPVHFTPPVHPIAFVAGWIGVWGGVWWLWRRLEHKPFTIRKLGRWRFTEPVVIDRVWVSRWILGRRVWLVWHLAFHAHIFTLMNVGQFQTGMLSATFVFLEGREIATILRDVGHRLGRWKIPGIPKSAVEGLPVIPAQDPRLPQLHRDSAYLPSASYLVALAVVVAGVLAQVRWGADVDWRWGVAAAFALLAAIGLWRRWRTLGSPLPVEDENTGRPRLPWAYGPLWRLLVGSVIVWHLAAVMTWLLPAKDCLSKFRSPARKSFTTYLTRTTTDQGWGMFAPNPPRSNVFLKVMVTDQDGESWDLRTDVYAEEQKPIPWVWNTRIRKINRRIIGGESGPTSWYRKWYARYHCRKWALEHGGEPPAKVELIKVWYRIPTPEQTREQGYYVAEELLERAGHERVSYTERCENAVMGQLPNFVRERHGLPLLEDGKYRPWIKHKKRKWEKKREREAKRKEKKKEK